MEIIFLLMRVYSGYILNHQQDLKYFSYVGGRPSIWLHVGSNLCTLFRAERFYDFMTLFYKSVNCPISTAVVKKYLPRGQMLISFLAAMEVLVPRLLY